MKFINILGINISNYRRSEVLAKLASFWVSQKQHYLVTPNPEIILEAIGYDEELFYILNKADLALADGVGLKIASWFLGKNLPRITGADLLCDILQLAQARREKVAILHWAKGLSKVEDIEQILSKKYPRLQFVAQNIERQIAGQEKLEQILNKFQPTTLIVALGAPWQEKFIFHNLPKLSSVKIAIGVGGAIDFLTGKIKRAPKIFRSTGLEWLWRLFKQPWRWHRIYQATIVFPAKFFMWRFVYPFMYRPNVACLLYKKEQKKDGASYQILTVERVNEAGHWQIPQGGIDGEDIMTAGKRELTEEIGTNKFRPIAALKNLHVYEFGDRMSKFGVTAKVARGYRGQKQSLFIAEFLGSDDDIRVNYWEHRAWRWVKAEDLTGQVFPTRRQSTEIFLNKFWQIVKK